MREFKSYIAGPNFFFSKNVLVYSFFLQTLEPFTHQQKRRNIPPSKEEKRIHISILYMEGGGDPKI